VVFISALIKSARGFQIQRNATIRAQLRVVGSPPKKIIQSYSKHALVFNRTRLPMRWDVIARQVSLHHTLRRVIEPLAVNKSGTVSPSYHHTILCPDVAHISRLAQQSVPEKHAENPQIYAHFAYSFQA